MSGTDDGPSRAGAQDGERPAAQTGDQATAGPQATRFPVFLLLFPTFARLGLFLLALPLHILLAAALLFHRLEAPAAIFIASGAAPVPLLPAPSGVSAAGRPPALLALLLLRPRPLARKRLATGGISRRTRFIAALQAGAMIRLRHTGGGRLLLCLCR
jgi:hypothetical protein